MNLKKIGKVFTSKFVATGSSSYEKRTYRAGVSQRLRNTALDQPFAMTVEIVGSSETLVPIYRLKRRQDP
jgi:hypothetical protein